LLHIEGPKILLPPFQNECRFNQKSLFQNECRFTFQYNFNFFLPTLPSINTQTFLSANFQCNFNFVFFLGILVKMLCLMIILFNFLICVQLVKATLILKQREYKVERSNLQKKSLEVLIKKKIDGLFYFYDVAVKST